MAKTTQKKFVQKKKFWWLCITLIIRILSLRRIYFFDKWCIPSSWNDPPLFKSQCSTIFWDQWSQKNILYKIFTLYGFKICFYVLYKYSLNRNNMSKVFYFYDLGVICIKDKVSMFLIPNGCFSGFAQRHDPGKMYPSLKCQWVTP